MFHIAKFILATLVLALCLPVVAFAQEALPNTVVNVGDLVSPWLQLLFAAAATIIPAAAVWAAAELRRRTGISIEASHREALQVSLTNAAGLLIGKLGERAQGVTFDARHPAVREAIVYVNAAAPDALSYFGLRPDQIAEKIAAKLGAMTAQEQVISSSSTGTGG